MKKKQIELGDEFYVFTNWGICKGHIVDIKNGQYKLNIDINDENKNKEHDFYYCENQLYQTLIDAMDGGGQ